MEHDGNSTVKISFTVPIDTSTAENIENYLLDSYRHPLAALYLPEIQSVQLLFKEKIDRQALQKLTIESLFNIDDFPLPQSIQFFGMGKSPGFQPLVISEIMAKPSPAISLPEAEYIELKNTGEEPLQLKGIRLADSQSSATLTDAWLAPGDYLILCSTANVARLSGYGQCLGVSSFPNLNDAGDTLRLFSTTGQEIHSIAYTESWYNDAFKSKGGWSLEMIDTEWPCQGMSNWRASENKKGGTPGKANSVQQSNPDLQAPLFLSALAEDSLHVSLLFSEKLERYAAEEAKITLKDVAIESVSMAKEAKQLIVKLLTPLRPGIIYSLEIS